MTYRPAIHLPPERLSKEIQVDKEFDYPKEDEEQQTDEVSGKPEPLRVIQEENNTKELQAEENPGVLQEEIKRKEKEIEELKLAIKRMSGEKFEGSGELYTRIDRAIWDRHLLDERKKITNISLEQQVLQKLKIKTMEEVDRDKAIADRLQMLQGLRQAEQRERIEAINRAQKYGEELSVQAAFQKQLHEVEMHRYRADIPRPRENPPPPRIITEVKAPHSYYTKGIGYSPEKQYSPNFCYLTKKAPKTLIFNPITGELRDTAITEQPSFSNLKHKRFSPDLGSYAKIDDERKRSFFKGAANYIVNGNQ